MEGCIMHQEVLFEATRNDGTLQAHLTISDPYLNHDVLLEFNKPFEPQIASSKCTVSGAKTRKKKRKHETIEG